MIIPAKPKVINKPEDLLDIGFSTEEVEAIIKNKREQEKAKRYTYQEFIYSQYIYLRLAISINSFNQNYNFLIWYSYLYILIAKQFLNLFMILTIFRFLKISANRKINLLLDYSQEYQNYCHSHSLSKYFLYLTTLTINIFMHTPIIILILPKILKKSEILNINRNSSAGYLPYYLLRHLNLMTYIYSAHFTLQFLIRHLTKHLYIILVSHLKCLLV